MNMAEYLTENLDCMDDSSAAAAEQIPESAWAAVMHACKNVGKFGSDPGIDCDLAITRETLADFNASREQWAERGTRAEAEIDGYKMTHYQRFQAVKGQRRTNMVVVDAGELRICLTMDA